MNATIYPNPFIPERADPYITKGPDGTYYFTASYPMKSADDPIGYDRVVLRKAKSVKALATAEELTIWKVSDTTLTHRFIWAPELHYISGKWYVFYAGCDRTDTYWNFDCHVLLCEGCDPYMDSWKEIGRFQKTPDDGFSFTGFSLDMTYFETNGKSYVIWAQQSPVQRISTLYMGEVNPEEPWKLLTAPMVLTTPEYDWEKVRYPVNEGPAVLKRDDMVYVCYSASGTGPEYCVGLLEASADADLLCPASWKKYHRPLLSSTDLIDEYGPGHNSFTKDENEDDLFIYHARSRECFEGKCGYADNDPLFDPCRHARVRKVKWLQTKQDKNDFPFIIL